LGRGAGQGEAAEYGTRKFRRLATGRERERARERLLCTIALNVEMTK
jgi:glycerol kinase